MKRTTCAIVAMLVIAVAVGAQRELIKATMAPNGLMGYTLPNGEWVLPPCADRLDADSAYYYPGNDYYFIVEKKGKKGVVDSKGRFVIEPIYTYAQFMTCRNFNYGPGSLLVHPIQQIAAVQVMTGKEIGINKETRLLDIHTGADIINRPLWAVDPIRNSKLDINYQTGIVVALVHNFFESKIDNDGKEGNLSCDSVLVLDFNGKDLMPGIQKALIKNNWKLTSGGKNVGTLPCASVMIDGIPFIVAAKASTDDLCLVALGRLNDLKNVVMMTTDGKTMSYKPTKPQYWLEEGTFYTEDFAQYEGKEIGKKFAKSAGNSMASVSSFRSRQQAADAVKNERLLAESKSGDGYTPRPDEWSVDYTSPDSTFSIVDFQGRKGIAVFGNKLTVPCRYKSIKPLKDFQGVFVLANNYGKGLSDGYSVTSPCGFTDVKVNEDGLIVLSSGNNSLSYKEYADSTGMPIANNLDELLSEQFPEGSHYEDKDTRLFSIIQSGVKAGRKFVEPYCRVYYATVLEQSGNDTDLKQALFEYERALYEDSRLTFAKERIDVLTPIVQNIRDREEAERKAQLRAERAARAEAIAAALNQMSVAIGNMANAINNTRRHHNVTASPARTTTKSGSTRQSVTSKTAESGSTAKKSSKEKHKTVTASEVNSRNIQRKVYNNWSARLEAMKNKWYPYNKGYTMRDVQQAQSEMRSIRTKWEARGLWPYGADATETWSGM